MRRIAIALISIYLLAGCSGQLLFLDTEQKNVITMQTAENGTTFSQELPVSFSIKYSSAFRDNKDQTDLLQVVIHDKGGNLVAKKRVNLDTIVDKKNFKFILPKIKDGVYRIRFEYYDGASLIAKKESIFFYQNGNYDIAQIEVIPPVVYPNSSLILAASIKDVASKNPYLRWSSGGETIAEGFYSDRLSEIIWIPPEKTSGIYPVKLELFPAKPIEDEDSPLSSSIFARTSVTVAREIAQGKNELGPNSSYTTLLHFRGNLRDDGEHGTNTTDEKGKIVPLGTVVPAYANGIFGYKLKGKSGILIDDFSIPIENGTVMPFSLTFRIQPFVNQRNKALYSTKTFDGNFTLRILTDPDGVFYALFSNGKKERVITSGFKIKDGEKLNFNISFLPEGNDNRVFWFFDGSLIHSELLNLSFSPIKNVGDSFIGGDNAYECIIDEFGVYFRDEKGNATIDARVYANAMARLHNENLVYADSFDGLFLSGSLAPKGDVYLSIGDLHINSGGSVTFPLFSFNDEYLVLEILFEKTSGQEHGEFHFDHKKQRLMTLSTKGEITIGERGGADVGFATDNSITLIFKHKDKNLSVKIGDKSYPISSLKEFAGLTLIAEKRANMKLPLIIHSIIARYLENDSAFFIKSTDEKKTLSEKDL
jgi:hypothetical protein